MESREFTEWAILFKKAEQAVKQLEGAVGDLAIPAINELRYAGFHAVQALAEEDLDVRREKIDQGERHCKRAIFDTTEIGIAYYIEAIKLFRDDYKSIELGPVIPDYLDCISKVRAAQDFMGQNSLHAKDYDYEKGQEHYSNLEHIFRRFEDARPELNKSFKRTRLNLYLLLLGIIFGLLGILATIVLS